MALQKRSYLPRSTINYAALRGVYEFAEKHKVSFGKAIEILLLESKGFNDAIDSLAKGSKWFENDIKEFKSLI